MVLHEISLIIFNFLNFIKLYSVCFQINRFQLYNGRIIFEGQEIYAKKVLVDSHKIGSMVANIILNPVRSTT